MTYTAITTQEFRQKKGTLAEKLSTEFGLIEAEYDTEMVTMPTAMDLSGSAITHNVFVAERAYTITAAYLVFTEASSADGGINVIMGKIIVGTDDDDYFVTAESTTASQETGARQALTLAQTAVAEGDLVTVNSAGGKTGTGEVILQLYLTRV